ncbi:hypothetical protein AMATHDRAFT_148969 [Amanita thiersii Skay4041]|uniref:F-box domain-containing protein n=1 Tax=Amanita thiersii Skay4041 TaxID=703135 RepID=A0A2A9NCV8_9AGAR|nr:hypothetical protein AMATHDRAFT_148969 [Amanita thiersii Skay4041]
MPRHPSPLALDAIPQEVLEHIAFFTATDSFLGPPSTLIPLICVNRHLHSCLSFTANYHLYARIFADKFDITAVTRRLGADKLAPHILALELQRRCFYLSRLRARVDAKFDDLSDKDIDPIVEELLYNVYLMMLENDGKNERQLREYGLVSLWLRDYWFDRMGASRVPYNILRERWPPNTRSTSIAMWLLWLFLEPDKYGDVTTITLILRIFALSAHQYNLTLHSWLDFLPNDIPENTSNIIYYSQQLQIATPPLAVPAILAFLTLVNTLPHDSTYPNPLTPSMSRLPINNSLEWECEWGRCISVGRSDPHLATTFNPGSIDGVWEGFFTYTEFTAYAALLAGAPPSTLHKSMVVRHRQTWKLREHHLLNEESSIPDSGIEIDPLRPLSAGDPLRSYFPIGIQIKEHRDGIHLQEPHTRHVLHYQRASLALGKNNNGKQHVRDIIVTGEGHSAWGQFNLIGRIRACDGFVSLSKEYIDGDRGKWLYRGYLVGNVNGNLAGRWRDTLSPADVPGYEGCFVMSRRR